MKTKMYLLLTGLMLSFSVWSNNSTNEHECLKNDVQFMVQHESTKWDFTSIISENSVAVIDFSIKENGKIKVNEIVTDDPEFRTLIERNISKIVVNSCDINTELHFYLKLKHSRK